MRFNTNPCAKPTPLAMLLLKPLLKAREKPFKALALDGFALSRLLVMIRWLLKPA